VVGDVVTGRLVLLGVGFAEAIRVVTIKIETRNTAIADEINIIL
jgi:hypothetical protein